MGELFTSIYMFGYGVWDGSVTNKRVNMKKEKKLILEKYHE